MSSNHHELIVDMLDLCFFHFPEMVGDGWLQGIVGDKFLPLTSLAFIIGSYKKIQSCHRERRKGGHWDGKGAG